MLCAQCGYAKNSQDVTCPRCVTAPSTTASKLRNASVAANSNRQDTQLQNPGPANQTSPHAQADDWKPNSLGLSRVIIRLIWGTMGFVTFIFAFTLLTPSPYQRMASTASSPSASAPESSTSTDDSASSPTSNSRDTNVIAIPQGPPFREVDATMDDRRQNITDAQRQIYWDKVVGSQVRWSGRVEDVSLNSGGELNLHCNPNSLLTDTRVDLDGSQLDLLPRIQKGQTITVEAILKGHGMTGYYLGQGRIVE